MTISRTELDLRRPIFGRRDTDFVKLSFMQVLSGLSERAISLVNEDLTRLFFSRLVRPGDRVLDIGASVGEHTGPLSRLVGDEGVVHAFEPNVDHLATLAAIGSNVRVWPFAVGETLSLQRLHIPQGLDGWASLEDIRAFVPGRSCELRTVVQVALDEIEVIREAWFSFMKLDVERREFEALAGSRCLVECSQPAIVLESATLRIEAWLGELGYDLLTFFGESWSPAAAGLPNSVAIHRQARTQVETCLPDSNEVGRIVSGAAERFPQT